MTTMIQLGLVIVSFIIWLSIMLFAPLAIASTMFVSVLLAAVVALAIWLNKVMKDID